MIPSVNQTSDLRTWTTDRGTDLLMPPKSVTWTISTGSLRSPARDTSRCTPASSAVELLAVVPAVIGVNRVGQLLLS